MSVVGEQRFSGGGIGATYHPVVASKALANLVV